MREFALIDRLSERLSIKRPDTQLAIGDDCALLAPSAGHALVVTTDTLIAGRHFPDDTPAFDIGYKAIAVNLSDLAAMGADPAWLTIALAAPALDAVWCDALLEGMLAAIGGADIDIVGGDTTRGPLSLTVTAMGQVPMGEALLRSGAREGDTIAVTGTLGDAAYGLVCWPERAHASAAQRHAIERLARPAWRRGAVLRGLAHAVIDLSDGLVSDLGHILTASGVGATLDVTRLPASFALDDLPREARRRMQLAGGDDYELCVALAECDIDRAREQLGCAFTPVGRIEAEAGLRLVDDTGRALSLATYAGWDHFS